MAAAADRREARRKRILQNSEDRFKTILGGRSSHSSLSESQLEPSEVPSVYVFSPSVASNEDVLFEADEISKPSKGSTDQDLNDHIEHETEGVNVLDSETGQEAASSGEQVTELSKEVPSSVGTTNRIVLNAVLAFVLVGRWTYVNLDALLFSRKKQATTSSSELVVLKSEGMIWPFLALQLLILCVYNYRQTSHSASISVITVVLQLCGIPVRLTNTINFVVTSLLAAFKDFVVFLFAVVLVHHAVEYSISRGFLQLALQKIEDNW